MMSLTRRHLRDLGAKITNRGVRILGKDEVTPEDIRASIVAAVHKAGWRVAPLVACVDSKRQVYATELLPVVGDCWIQLVFTDEGTWRVGSYQVADTGTYVMEVAGKDGKVYPQALEDLHSPTKAQIDKMLTEAGLTDGQQLLKEIMP